jgi:hypothetical protein
LKARTFFTLKVVISRESIANKAASHRKESSMGAQNKKHGLMRISIRAALQTTFYATCVA